MSIAEIERFAADLNSNPALRAEAAGRKVTDAELDGVAGRGITSNLGFTSIWALLFGG